MMMIRIMVILNTFYIIQTAISYLSYTLTIIDIHRQTIPTRLTTHFIKTAKQKASTVQAYRGFLFS